jgi:hypothetical protein
MRGLVGALVLVDLFRETISDDRPIGDAQHGLCALQMNPAMPKTILSE